MKVLFCTVAHIRVC